MVTSMKLVSVAKQRYLDFLLIKGSVDVREELKKVENKYYATLRGVFRSRGERRQPTRVEVWTFFFAHAERQPQDASAKELVKCYRSRSDVTKTPAHAAISISRIFTNLNKQFHRSMTVDEIRMVGGIPLYESSLLPLDDCRLLRCVFDFEAMPARVVLDEQLDPLANSSEFDSDEDNLDDEDSLDDDAVNHA